MGLCNAQYDEIMRDYNRRQLDARRQQDEHRRQIYEKVPAIRKLDEETAMVAAGQARELLSGGRDVMERLRNRLKDLKEQKDALLLSAGFPTDYLELHYNCKLCQDTGYVGNEKCSCFKHKEIELLYSHSNLSRVLEQENFDTFSFQWFEDKTTDGKISPLENMKNVHRICREMTEDFSVRPQNLLLMGPAGTGKTFLTHCIAKALIDSCFSVIYLSANALFELLSEQRFAREQEEEYEFMYQNILECDLLIVDDLGTELSNAFTVSELFHCINERAAREKAMVISTNLSLNRMRDIYSERITSRLISDYRILHLYGADIRIKKMMP